VQAWLWHVNIVNTRLSDHRQNQPKERPICKVEYCTGERKEVENPVEANAMRCFVFVAVGLSVREGKSDFGMEIVLLIAVLISASLSPLSFDPHNSRMHNRLW
jgi:hypothetical protein